MLAKWGLLTTSLKIPDITNNIVGPLRAGCGPYSQMILRFLLDYSKQIMLGDQDMRLC